MDQLSSGNVTALPQGALRRRRENWPIRLRRAQASQYLEEVHGYLIAPSTLAQMAVQGRGPPYEKWGAFPYYLPETLDYWAAERLAQPPRRRARKVAPQPDGRAATEATPVAT